MADARKTWAQLDVIFATNAAGAISAQDLRDGFQSIQPHEAAENPDTSDDETSGFDVGHKWLNTSDGSIWECRNASTGSADWVKVYPQDAGGGGAGALDDLSDVDTSGATDNDLFGLQSGVWLPIASTSDFATAAQGGLADTAVQPGDDADTLGSGDATDGYVLTADGAGGAAWEAASGGGGGGAADFTDLGDAPSAYTSSAGQFVRVNSTPDGLEFHQLVDGFDKMVALDETTYAGLTPDEDTIYFIEADA